MASKELVDRRLHDRSERKGEVQAPVLKAAILEQEDCADNATTPDSQALTQVREELLTEKALRDQRIQRQLDEPPQAARVATPVGGPLDAEL